MDMKGVTREEAVLFLLSLQDQIDLIVQHRMDEYEQVVQSQRGDSFYVKWVFNNNNNNKTIIIIIIFKALLHFVFSFFLWIF